MGVLLSPVNDDAVERAARGLMLLTQSEYRVLRGLLAGLKPNEIAKETGLTKLTVQFYLKTVFRKCDCDRLSLVRMAPKLEGNARVARYLADLSVSGQSRNAGAFEPVNGRSSSAKTHDLGHHEGSGRGSKPDPGRRGGRGVERRPFRRRRPVYLLAE